jgi:polysaccharide export outer membrane protein
MDEASYRMQIGDVLAIRLPLMPDFNEETTIRPDGRISTAFAADVKAAGRTVPELTAALRDGYSREMRSPLISVNVKTYSPYRVYVAGEVVAPGEYQSQGPNLTLSQAITRAGGPKLSGAPADVFILRRGDGDRPIVMAANYKEVLHGTNPAADVRLARYDVVFVPRTTVAEMYIFFNQYLQQFVPVTWGFNYLLNNGSSSTAVK